MDELLGHGRFIPEALPAFVSWLFFQIISSDLEKIVLSNRFWNAFLRVSARVPGPGLLTRFGRLAVGCSNHR